MGTAHLSHFDSVTQMDSWALLLLKRRAEGPPTPEYSQAYVDGVNDAMILVGAAMAGMWFCGMAAFPRLYTPLRMYVAPWLARRVSEGEKVVVWFQQVNNPVLDVFHNTLALMCGVEFYITVLPFLFWIGEPQLARSMTIFCAAMTHIGNAMKDVFCSPRPRSPPVRRTEANKSQGDTSQSSTQEYGFPSTHSVNAICFAGYLIHFFNKQGYFADDEWWAPEGWPKTWLPPSVLCGLVLWCVNICYGRIYLGMHTPVDIAGGIIVGWILLGFWILVEDFCDAWITAGFTGLPLYQLIYSVVILWAYPIPLRPNPSFSYSLYLTAACNGVVIGVWRTFPQIHSLEWAAAVQAERGALMTLAGGGWAFRRFVVGIPIVLLAREVGKAVGVVIIPPLAKLLQIEGQFEDKVRGAASIPKGVSNLSNGYRFVAYTAVGWATTDLVFIVFGLLGI